MTTTIAIKLIGDGNRADDKHDIDDNGTDDNGGNNESNDSDKDGE